MSSAEFHSEIQRARVNERWRKEGARSTPIPRQAKLKGTSKLTADEKLEAWKNQVVPLLTKLGILPAPQLPDINRVTRRRGPINHLPAPVPEVTVPLFARAKARMSQERGKDLPDGYWGRKQRLYLAAMEEAVEETRDEMYRIVGLAHLMKEVGNMIRGRGEMARRISEEEERAMEAEVEAMSDEELGLTRDEPRYSEQPGASEEESD
jgi:hypothetical protein